uniref:Uncharacterized protein n=1 Tax=Arion vulgaris TaxID=1028688 RepID=A0A0B6ZJ17_9EUPU
MTPHLEYDSTTWSATARSHLHTLDNVQNQTLRVITRAMTTTSIAEMLKTTGVQE